MSRYGKPVNVNGKLFATPKKKKKTEPKLVTNAQAILHSGDAPWHFFHQKGEHSMSAFDPRELGLIWFPGIKYRVTVEVVGYEHRDWGCGPRLKEAQSWLKKDARYYKKFPWQKDDLLKRIAGLKEVEKLKKLLDKKLNANG